MFLGRWTRHNRAGGWRGVQAEGWKLGAAGRGVRDGLRLLSERTTLGALLTMQLALQTCSKL